MKKIAILILVIVINAWWGTGFFGEEKKEEVWIKDIKISGNEIIEEAEIKLYILSKKDELLNLDKLNKDVKRIYNTGYFKTVDYQMGERDIENKVEVVFIVKEIWDKTITAIEIEGVKNLLAEIFLNFLTLEIGEPLDKEKIKKNQEMIYATGYVNNVKVDLSPYQGGTKVKFVILENQIISEIEFAGNTIFSKDELLKLVSSKKSSVLNFFTLQEDRKIIEDFYLKKGYICSVYDLDSSPSGQLNIFLAETTVEDIKIEGEGEEEIVNDDGKKEKVRSPKKLKTKDYVIKREIRHTKVGEILDVNKIKKDLQRIYNLGYFENIAWHPERGTKEDRVVVVIKITEGLPRGQAIFGASYGSGGKLSGQVSVSKDNLFGRGRKASISSEFGYITSYSISYFEPWADKKNTSLGLEVFNTTIKRELRQDKEVTSYDEKKSGGSIVVGRPIGENTRLSLGIEGKNVDIVEKSGPPIPSNYISEGKVRSLTLTYTKDTRDNVFSPATGKRDNISVESSGGMLGGNVDFTKYEIDFRKYWRLKKSKFIFAQRLQGGIYDGTKLLAEEFYIGGADTIRGYDENVSQGTKMLTLNSEVRFPIAGNFTGCFFYDWGDAWIDKAKISNFKRGTGLGVRFLIPGLGPIRLDWGYNLQESQGQIHFSFGQMF